MLAYAHTSHYSFTPLNRHDSIICSACTATLYAQFQKFPMRPVIRVFFSYPIYRKGVIKCLQKTVGMQGMVERVQALR